MTANPYRARWTPGTAADYQRALAAEPRLRAVDRLVAAVCELARPSDLLCEGCVWSRIVRPLLVPLVGSERGTPTEPATDRGSDDPVLRFVSVAELLDRADRTARYRIPAATETERWLRSPAAWHAVADTLLARLWDADPGNGHGIGRASVVGTAVGR